MTTICTMSESPAPKKKVKDSKRTARPTPCLGHPAMAAPPPMVVVPELEILCGARHGGFGVAAYPSQGILVTSGRLGGSDVLFVFDLPTLSSLSLGTDSSTQASAMAHTRGSVRPRRVLGGPRAVPPMVFDFCDCCSHPGASRSLMLVAILAMGAAVQPPCWWSPTLATKQCT